MKTHGRTVSKFLYSLSMGLALLWVPVALRAQSSAGDGALQPGDKVQVTVWQRDELSGDFTVSPDGSLNHPLYRELRVTGMPASQLEERLRSFLSAYEANPQVVVQTFYRVAVSGSVMRPDIYDIPSGTTVSGAITQAGGFTEVGDREEVRLYRDGNETELDLTQGDAVRMLVASGDEILVPSDSGESMLRSVVLPLVQIGFTIANIIIYRD